MSQHIAWSTGMPNLVDLKLLYPNKYDKQLPKFLYKYEIKHQMIYKNYLYINQTIVTK